MLVSNWHTHTYRCGHAKGTDEEYVLEAINAGLKRIGFSDHAAYPGVRNNTIRMTYKQVPEYMHSIRKLKEKYKDQIEIYLGMEIEGYDEYLETLEYYRRELDYCILGQHGFSIENEDSYFIKDKEGLLRYVELIEKACAKGLCDYIAHPDVCLWSYPNIDSTVIEVANRIADVSLKYNIPVEANCGSGVRRGKREYLDGFRYPYPTKAFFEVFARKGCEVVIGLDIHDPQLFKTDEYIDRVYSVIKDLGCNIIEDYDLPGNALKRRKEFGFIE